jgi:hypothetical protein
VPGRGRLTEEVGQSDDGALMEEGGETDGVDDQRRVWRRSTTGSGLTEEVEAYRWYACGGGRRGLTTRKPTRLDVEEAGSQA